MVAYAHTQKSWALLSIGRSSEGVSAAEYALSLLPQLTDDRDNRYVRLKAGCGAARSYLQIGDLIKARARAKEVMDFARTSDSRRALSLGHNTMGAIYEFTGDVDRARAEFTLAHDTAPDPMYGAVADMALGAHLARWGFVEEARVIAEPARRFADAQGNPGFELGARVSLALIMLMDGDLSRGMDQLEAMQYEVAGSPGFVTQSRMMIATIYARIATGEGMAPTGGAAGAIGTLVRNPGFVLGRARKASQTARDSFEKLSAELQPDREGFRFAIEFEYAKLLIKRKERDEARKHLEKAIAFLQPLGDTIAMRDCRAVLATLDQK